MAVILPILTGISCVLAFFLSLRDRENYMKQENEQETLEINQDIPRSFLIYSAIMLAGTVTLAIFLPRMFPNNGIWVNTKRMILLSLIWPIAYIDFKTLRIPNLFVVYGLICRAVILVFEIILKNPAVWVSFFGEAVASGGLFLAAMLCALVIKNGIGFGDIKLFIVMGLFLGMNGIWEAIFVALCVSFLIAIYLLITKKKTRKDVIPFGPALVIGSYLTVCLSGM